MATMVQLFLEAYRHRLLQGLEEILAQAGYGKIAGVDEAGRGSLAGPVVAAAVLIGPGRWVPGVDDSKQLRAGDRERLAVLIQANALATAVVPISPATIDRINVLEATRRAMKKALKSLHPGPDCAVTDAVALPGMGYPCLPVVRADAMSFSVACASILAKVARDRMMVELHQRYPQYGFAEHKGYGAPEHRRALERYGPCPVHRLTFRSVLPRPPERSC